jgi:hypothetical protein
VVFTGTVADAGVIVTAGSCTATVAVANLVASAVLVARTDTVPAVIGAVNTPEGVIVPPVADQVTFVDAVKEIVPPVVTVAEGGVMVTGGRVTVTVAVAVLLESAMLVAVTVTVPVLAGAVKMPAAEIDPADVLQLTAADAVKDTVPPGATLALEGVINSGGAVTVTVAVADFEVSAVLVALMVTVPADIGAVNSPAADIEPAVALHVTVVEA